MKKILGIVIAIAIVSILAGAAALYKPSWLVWNKKAETSMVQQGETTSSETSNWKAYRREEYGFEIQYPADSKVIDENSPEKPQYLLGFYYRVASGNSFVEICADDFCGTFGPGIGSFPIAEDIVLSGKNFRASGFYSENEYGTSKIFATNTGDLTVRYGVASEKRLSDKEVRKADMLTHEILNTFRFDDSRDPVAASTELRGQFEFPKGGETFTIGGNQTISWRMPNGRNTYYSIEIFLLDEQGEAIGNIINWNWVKYIDTTSARWDVKTVYQRVQTGLTPEGSPVHGLKPGSDPLQPGRYKLRLEYEYSAIQERGSFDSAFFEIK